MHGLHECARGGGGEVGLGAAVDAYAAVYVGKNGMSLALDPTVAQKLATDFNFPCRARNDTTSYVRVAKDRLADAAARSGVRDALEQAGTPSWPGPPWARGIRDRQPGQLVPVRPVHHLELAADGGCGDRGGGPPH